MSKGPFGKIDPNVQAHRDFVLRQFAAQVANGQVFAVDRINQKIEVGSLVVWRPPADLIFEVLEVSPVLNPNEPPGRLKLALSTLVPDHVVPANVRQLSMIVIGKQMGPGHADISGPKMQAEPSANSQIQADLLAALEELLDWSTSEYQSNPAIDAKARAAIARARGEQVYVDGMLAPGEHDPRD